VTPRRPARPARRLPPVPPPDAEPQWYKDAVIYELHVRAFADSNADGIGDFAGLTGKLDYLQELGVTALWLLPFYPSPLRDDGYDIADYTDIHPDYGTLRDFREFLREAHARGLRVITELVLNHTSDQHQWFQRARRAKPGTPARDFYVWSDTPDRYRDARIIFKDFEHSNWAWDPVARSNYWHRFYSHQPDLNYENPAVHEAVFEVLDFWLEMGVDGLRLDAVPYLYEREGTNCENLPETHDFLRALRLHVDQRYPNRLLLAEANQWPEDAVAYFGRGDEAHMAYHFPLMPRMFMAIWMEDRFPIIDILAQTPPVPDAAQWALFLRNHDELTLEMVTDEERDYMYRVYAYDRRARINLGIRRRLAPLFGNHRRSIELMNGLLMSLPGTPVLYYGDEVGMGDNIYLGDRNAVRTPMQWSADRNAGFSRANPQRLYLPINIDPEYHYEAVNVEAQRNNTRSLYWWMKRLIALRKQHRAFGRGTLEFLYPDNPKVLAFIRRLGDEQILVVANLSRFAQYVELDLSAHQGLQPTEMFGRTPFPRIGELPYLLTLAPHGFYWFALERPQPRETVAPEADWPRVEVTGEWTDAWVLPRSRAALEALLPGYLRARRWFGGRGRGLKSAAIAEAVPIPAAGPGAVLALVAVEYLDGDPERYALPLTFASGEDAERLRRDAPHAIISKLHVTGADGTRDGLLVDALWSPAVAEALFQMIARRRRLRGEHGTVAGWPTRDFRRRRDEAAAPLVPRPMQAEQRNTSIVFGDRFILKLLRKVEEGPNPELGIQRFLQERTSLRHVPPMAGALEYHREGGEPSTLAVLNAIVPNEGDAWRYTLDHLADYYERVLTLPAPERRELLPDGGPASPADVRPPGPVEGTIGPYLEFLRLIGRRTGELHLALASDPDDAAFAPEPFTALYQRSLYQSMRNAARRVFQALRRAARALPADARDDAVRLAEREAEVLEHLGAIRARRITATRIRIHGDYHLGHILYLGKDVVIIDFEGDPARTVSERLVKRSALRDVVGLLHSLHSASLTVLREHVASGVVRPEDAPVLGRWARLWSLWAGAAFQEAYLRVAGSGSFLPRAPEELAVLLDVYSLDHAIVHLGAELGRGAESIAIPVAVTLDLLGTPRPRA
jgi:maltose alpha-D-glucosyltransferase/alpha-amylase